MKMDTTTNQLSESTDDLTTTAIIRDYPLFEEIENSEAKRIIAEAFDSTTGMRAEFLKWAFAANVAKVQGEKGGLAYELPNGVSLRPEAMDMLEEDLIARAYALPADAPVVPMPGVFKTSLEGYANFYKNRFAEYLETMKTQLLFAQL